MKRRREERSTAREYMVQETGGDGMGKEDEKGGVGDREDKGRGQILDTKPKVFETWTTERSDEGRVMEMGMDGDSGREEDRVEGGKENLQAATAAGWLTHEELPGGTTQVDACDGSKNLSRLAMLWTVQQR